MDLNIFLANRSYTENWTHISTLYLVLAFWSPEILRYKLRGCLGPKNPIRLQLKQNVLCTRLCVSGACALSLKRIAEKRLEKAIDKAANMTIWYLMALILDSTSSYEYNDLAHPVTSHALDGSDASIEQEGARFKNACRRLRPSSF